MEVKIRRKNIIATIKVVLSLAALYFVFTRINPAQIRDIYAQSRPLLLIPVILLFVLSKVCSAWRLNMFFERIDISLQFVENLKLYWVGMFYNMFLPGGIGGDGYKVLILRQQSMTPTRQIIGAVLFDRVWGVFLLSVLAFFLTIHIIFNPYPMIWVSAPVGLLVFWAGLWLANRFMSVYKPLLLKTSILSLGVQFLQMASLIFLLFAFNEFENYIIWLVVFLVSSVVSVLPVSIGGAGAREVIFLYGAKWFALDPALAVTLSLTLYFITALVSLSGVAFVFKFKK
ncbi:MAG: lysylphosphatidylglycerol synthase transmembrane domain-containing protein [Bacteroidales bacterium]